MFLMNRFFIQHLDKFVLVFLGDIPIYSKNEVEHEENLILVLKFFRERHLYAKLNKCDFYQIKVQYLGHVISKEGIIINLENIAAIMEWPTLKDVLDVISSMGLEIYYHRFIREVFQDQPSHHLFAMEECEVCVA